MIKRVTGFAVLLGMMAAVNAGLAQTGDNGGGTTAGGTTTGTTAGGTTAGTTPGGDTAGGTTTGTTAGGTTGNTTAGTTAGGNIAGGSAGANSANGGNTGLTDTARQDLSTVLQANLQEAATLRAELPALQNNKAALRVWRHMIDDHTKGAATLAKMLGQTTTTSDQTPPAGQPATGSVDDIIGQTLQAHRDMLNTLKGLEQHAQEPELKILRKQEKVVERHIQMLQALNNGHGEHKSG